MPGAGGGARIATAAKHKIADMDSKKSRGKDEIVFGNLPPVAAPKSALSLRKTREEREQEQLEKSLGRVIRKGPTLRALKRHIDRRHLAMRLPPLLFMFCVFVAIVLMNRDIETAYNFERTVSTTLLHEEVDEINFFKIHTTGEWFEWMDGAFKHFMYDTDWYNGDPKDDAVTEHTYLNVNKILGGVILIQRRVKEGTCDESDRFEEFVPQCWGGLTGGNEETEEPFGENGRWTTSEIHGASGYIELLPLDEEGAHDKILELRDGAWIDLATREIDVDFSLYNHNINQVLVARLKFFFTKTGFVRKEAVLHTIRLEPYATSLDDARTALEVVFVILVVLQICYEAYEVYLWGFRHGNWAGYILSGWPVLRWLNISFNLAIIGVWATYIDNGQRSKVELPFPNNEIEDFEHVAEDVELFLTLSGVNVLVFVLVVFETLRFSDKFAFVTNTFKLAWPKLWSFIVLFAFVFFGFATMGHILFGHTLEQFSTVFDGINASFEIITGEQGYEQLNEVDSISAAIFYYSFLVIVFFLLVNVFIAILADAYLELTSERKFRDVQENRYDLGDYYREFRGVLFGKGHLFRSAQAVSFLADPAFRITDRIAEGEAAKVARARGLHPDFVPQLFERYGVKDRELAGHERIQSEATSLHAAIVQEFDLLPSDEVLGLHDIREIKKRIISHVETWEGPSNDPLDDDLADFATRYRGENAIDWDASQSENSDGASASASSSAYSSSSSASSSSGSSYDSSSSASRGRTRGAPAGIFADATDYSDLTTDESYSSFTSYV